jgi:phosphoglycerate kinase
MSPSFQTLNELDAGDKRVAVRADLNVPLENGIVRDATRIERISPTLRELSEQGARVIVLSHLGRPKGEAVPSMSLAPVAGPLSVALDRPVRFVDTDWMNGEAQRAVNDANRGDILLMENTRFHPGEEKNQPAFVKQLVDLADIYVNDAFSAAHRAHASTEGMAHFLPAFAGRAMEAELKALTEVLDKPERPLVAVIGGAKISTKLDLLADLCARVDTMVIAGGMANTFLAAQGHPVGKSLCEHELTGRAGDILAAAKSTGCDIVLPLDVVVAEDFKPHAHCRTAALDDVRDDEMILDIGEATIAALKRIFDDARTVVWNGPFGAFELPPFDNGTNAAARLVAERVKTGRLKAIAGGGDTVAALKNAGVADDFSYVSTAGGAFLEWLQGKVLPGVQALSESRR